MAFGFANFGTSVGQALRDTADIRSEAEADAEELKRQVDLLMTKGLSRAEAQAIVRAGRFEQVADKYRDFDVAQFKHDLDSSNKQAEEDDMVSAIVAAAAAAGEELDPEQARIYARSGEGGKMITHYNTLARNPVGDDGTKQTEGQKFSKQAGELVRLSAQAGEPLGDTEAEALGVALNIAEAGGFDEYAKYFRERIVARDKADAEADKDAKEDAKEGAEDVKIDTKKASEGRKNALTVLRAIRQIEEYKEAESFMYESSFTYDLMKFVPLSDAREISGAVDTIKAHMGFQALQAMRESSKTGGALGQITERELALLQATAGTLDPGAPETFMENLAAIKAITQKAYRDAEGKLLALTDGGSDAGMPDDGGDGADVGSSGGGGGSGTGGAATGTDGARTGRGRAAQERIAARRRRTAAS